MSMFNCPTCGRPKHQTAVYCGGTACTVGPRETVESLRGAPATDPRWLLVCNFIGCGNLLRVDEHLVCEDHPKSKAFTVERE